ncbi:hypothetical protein LFYK43_01430 [Ligilactobacillus salitolerans]|uniref:Uncharacterized protein n=1 Tax=Ligilactobacillus salitolerans TaxID=1808352 RepID=A0A401IQA6_9LACO|nr:hypothetical protein LFYK43_01430 [Ligilactobacillus salitolerans]
MLKDDKRKKPDLRNLLLRGSSEIYLRVLKTVLKTLNFKEQRQEPIVSAPSYIQQYAVKGGFKDE